MAEQSNTSQTAEMDQDMAQVLFRDGAILAFLDVPEGTEFGIDYNCWRVGHKFKGVKMIPPGIHFVYYSATNSDHQAAPRTGFFYDFKPKEVLVKKWDKYHEDISHDPVSSEEQQRFEQNKEELDRFLGPYPYESYKKWISLTSNITPLLLSELQPLNGRISSVVELESPASNTKQRREAREAQEHAAHAAQAADTGAQALREQGQEARDAQTAQSQDAHTEQDKMAQPAHTATCADRLHTQTAQEAAKSGESETSVSNMEVDQSGDALHKHSSSNQSQDSSQTDSNLNQSGGSYELDKDGLPELAHVPGAAIRFSKILARKWPEGASPAEISKYSMDHSYVLENLLNSDLHSKNNLSVLGEIQFAFICFLIGQVYDAFDQWKRLVHLLCHCDEALTSHVTLYDQFITMLHFQVREIPEDFFVDIISRNNFLTSTLHTFFSNLDNLEGDSEEIQSLKKKGRNFSRHLEKKFQWDFTTEDDEFAPTVVDL